MRRPTPTLPDHRAALLSAALDYTWPIATMQRLAPGQFLHFPADIGSPMSNRNRRLVLVTTDDGPESLGFGALISAVSAAGYEIVVVAPKENCSGVGTALRIPRGASAVRGVAADESRVLNGTPLTVIDGTPALAVLRARSGFYGSIPWCVVAGINHGSNTGRSVIHSGTVGAALSAASVGLSGLAISIDASNPSNLPTAERVVRAALGWLANTRRQTVLNVNVPDRPAPGVVGVRVAPLAVYGRLRVGEVEDGFVASGLPAEPMSDDGLLAAGFVTITQLSPVASVTEPGVGDLAADVACDLSHSGIQNRSQ